MRLNSVFLRHLQDGTNLSIWERAIAARDTLVRYYLAKKTLPKRLSANTIR